MISRRMKVRYGLWAMGYGLWAMGCGLWAVPGFCKGPEETPFVYDDKGKRDPFIPLITGQVKFATGLVGIEGIDDISLEGIVFDPQRGSLAILNGVILQENEQVNNVKLTKIEPRRVSIMINENEFTIDLIKEEGERYEEEKKEE